MRVSQNFVAGGGVKRSAFRILDARVEIKRRFFGAAGVVEGIRAGPGINILVIKVEVTGERAQLRGFRNPAKWIFRCDLRKLQRGLHHPVEAGAGEITGVGAGSTLAIKHAHANRSRTGFFQRFDLAETDQRGEFIAFAHYALGNRGAAVHGTADDVLRNLAKISFQFRVSGFELSGRHKKFFTRESQSHRKKQELEKPSFRISLWLFDSVVKAQFTA